MDHTSRLVKALTNYYARDGYMHYIDTAGKSKGVIGAILMMNKTRLSKMWTFIGLRSGFQEKRSQEGILSCCICRRDTKYEGTGANRHNDMHPVLR